jgi:ATP-dependent DNA helicase RecG
MTEKELQMILTAIFQRPARIAPTVFDESGGVFGGVFEGITDAVNATINEPITEGIKTRLAKELLHIVEYSFITRVIIENASRVSTATAKRDLFLLKKVGFIKLEGARKTGRYVLTEKGKKMIEELKA